MSGRLVTAVAIMVAWVAGIGMLVRREYFRPHIERLAEAALRVQPAAVFYAVMQGDRQVGFASSTIDTSTAMIEQREYLVADIPGAGMLERTTARTNVTLTRTLRVRTFEVELETERSRSHVRGMVLGDSLLQFVVGAAPDTQRVQLNGPILLPALAPLAIALEDRPVIGEQTVLPLFDPSTLLLREVRIDVRAESLFVVNDSSVFDPRTSTWYGVLPDTIRAWQIVSQSGAGISGWVDQQGRLIASTQLGFRLERRPYEVAFENWRRDSDRRAERPRAAVASDGDVLGTTLIAARKQPSAPRAELRVRLGGVPLEGFDLNGGRQERRGDTVVVRREAVYALSPRYALPIQQGGAGLHRNELAPEPFLEVEHPEIVALAERITRRSRDPRVTAVLINKWVFDSISKEATSGIPSALHVLHTRRGDANEHTQLFAALSRAAGLPTRIVSGLLLTDGKFHYHAWPEVLLRGWVAVDPTFGRFPADASYIRFSIGGLGRQAELERTLGQLTIDVIGSR